MNTIPITVSIAGYDCSAGAGVLADIKVFKSLEVFGLAATTAIVAQRPGHVGMIDWLEPSLFKSQLEEISSYPLSAIKIGMIGSEAILNHICEFLDHHPELPVVLDPVLKASAGSSLSKSDFIDSIRKDLLARTTLVTPNRSEAEVILNREIGSSPNDIKAACQEWVNQYGCSVLLKGGHFESNEQSIDYLCTINDPSIIETHALAKLNIPDLHGTGCFLSSAITALLAKKQSLSVAVYQAKNLLHQAMKDHYQWSGTDGSIEALK